MKLLDWRARKVWHRKVKKHGWELLYRDEARSVEVLRKLARVTDVYLGKRRSGEKSAEVDGRLYKLIENHTKTEDWRVVAVLACLNALTPEAGLKQLCAVLVSGVANAEGVEPPIPGTLPWVDSNVDKYLRCLALAGEVRPPIVSKEEAFLARLLLDLITTNVYGSAVASTSSKATGDTTPAVKLGTCPAVDAFEFLDALVQMENSSLLPLRFIKVALQKSSLPSLAKQVKQWHTDRQYLTLHIRLSWLRSHEIADGSDASALLDEFLPDWRQWASWRPKRNRIAVWEMRREYKPGQREDLCRLFDLEGPDASGRPRGTVKCTEDERCYELLNIDRAVSDGPERVLQALDRAFKSPLSEDATELFILLCVKRRVDEDALTNMNAVLDVLNWIPLDNLPGLKCLLGLYCALLKPVDCARRASLLIGYFRQSRDLVRRNIWKALPAGLVSDAIAQIVRESAGLAADVTAELEGEPVFVVLIRFSRACSWLPGRDELLTPEVRSWRARLPSLPLARACFPHVRADAPELDRRRARMQHHLRYLLDPSCEPPVDPELLRKEFEFWGSEADPDRLEVAKCLCGIEALPDALYISCLESLTLPHLSDPRRQFVASLRVGLKGQTLARRCAALASLLRNPLVEVESCWAQVLFVLLGDDRNERLHVLVQELPPAEWREFVLDVCQVVNRHSPSVLLPDGCVNEELLSWWQELSYEYANAAALLVQSNRFKTERLYLQRPPGFAELLGYVNGLDPATPLATRYLDSVIVTSPGDIPLILHCLKKLPLLEPWADILMRVLDRYMKWPTKAVLPFLVAMRRKVGCVDKEVQKVIGSVAATLGLLALDWHLSPDKKDASAQAVFQDYEAIVGKTRSLEINRKRLPPAGVSRLKTELCHRGLALPEPDEDETGLPVALAEGHVFRHIPEEMIDSCELVDADTVELCFALSGLNPLQRLARGVPADAKLLVLRLVVDGQDANGRPVVVYHVSVTSETGGESQTTEGEANLFQFGVSTNVHDVVSAYATDRDVADIFRAVHARVDGLIQAPPSTCVACCADLGAATWKPAACIAHPRTPRRVPLSVALHGLFADPDAVALLLSSLWHAAASPADNIGLLLPDCPLAATRLREVIALMPSTDTLAAAADLPAALGRGRAGMDSLAADGLALLAWLCGTFRGLMVTAPDGWRVPSMPPGTRQFLMVNPSPEKQAAFGRQRALAQGKSDAVFHGTSLGRLLPIARQGLRVLSGTPLMRVGAASGPGVYTGSCPRVAMGYTAPEAEVRGVGRVRVLLGCEVACVEVGAPALDGDDAAVLVVRAPDSLLVRYVFVLPGDGDGGDAPPRRHVKDAMNASFKRLRTGA